MHEGQPQPELESEMTTRSDNPEQEVKSFEYKFFPDVQQRMLLGEAVEKVIDRVVEVNNLDGQKEGEPPVVPNVIFLDMSARPLSTIFSRLWSKKYPDKARPHISFLNIGRELMRWGEPSRAESRDKKYFEMTPKIEQEIKRIKKQYLYLKEAPAGSTIVIIDDVCNTGQSRDAAIAILSKAFPNLKFEYQALTEGRSDGVDLKDYDRSNPRLFDSEGRGWLGSGEPFITTAPPWKSFGWYGVSPEGVTTVMDDDDKESSLTAIPYYKHKNYSNEARAERIKKYSKYKEKMEQSLKIVAEACQEIIDWEPSITNPTSEDRIVLDGLKEFKDKCRAFLENLPNIDKIGMVEFGKRMPKINFPNNTNHFCGYPQFLFKRSRAVALQNEILDFFGFSEYKHREVEYGGRIKAEVRQGSVVEKLWAPYRVDIMNMGKRENFEKWSKEIKIVELIQALRAEMREIADEYWEQKTKT